MPRLKRIHLALPPMRGRLLPLLFGAFILLFVSSARASKQEPPLSDYSITSWTTKDGLSSSIIFALAQDTEGYLWLGTNGGLIQFDGARFLTLSSLGGVPLPKAAVRSLFVARDGSLWIGFRTGEISHFHNGQLRTYTESVDSPGIITAFSEDRSGTMWAGSATGLLVFDGDRWQRAGGNTGLGKARIISTYIDRQGDLLISSELGIFRYRSDQTFERVDPFMDATIFRGFAEDSAGRTWISDPVVGFRQLGQQRNLRLLQHKGRGNYILRDREGDFWVATMGQGIWRFNPDHPSTLEKVDVFGPRTLIEDRDGSIWAGTGESLVRLKKPSVQRITNLGLATAVDTTPDGNVWVSTGDGVIRFPPGESSRALPVLPDVGVTALRADQSGAVWMASDKNLIRVAKGNVTKWPLAKYGLSHVTAITSDAHGVVWLADRNRGLFRWTVSGSGARIEPVAPQPDIIFTRVDRSGRVWFGASNGRLGMLESNGHVRAYSSEDGLGGGPYRTMFEDHLGTLWLGGIDGLYGLRNGKFVRINELARVPRLSVSDITEDKNGDLWLTTGSGLGFIRRSELDSAMTSPGKRIRQVNFDVSDGLAGEPVWFNSLGMVRASDGKIWCITGRGITVLDPHSLKIPQPPAKVQIDSVVLDERPATEVTELSNLPSRTNRLQINYSALQLDFAHPILFRYRLEGLDSDWVYADTHRQAVYTHLSPGKYLFRVAASNSDGSWNDVAATWGFSIQPAFYQTYFFLGVCMIGAGALIWAAWWFHVRRIRHEFAVVLAERVRLSRELHDTLLQSLVGVALQFDAASGNLPPSSPTRQRLVHIRKQVEQYIRDARRSIWNLRSPMLAKQDLPAALRESVARATDGLTIQSRIIVHGMPCHAPTVVEQQLLRIGQEAILNAMKHSHASQLDVELSYEGETVKLRVADDGCGFDPGRSPDDLAGHFGLITMQERAEEAGGRLTMKTDIGRGTVIEAIFPSHMTS
jgi:signal transduction histidine kinase/ligand-binding sensor domain-containing protein